MSGIPNPTQLRIKPVYDTGSFGHDVTFPLVLSQASNLSTLTPSTASFYQSTHDSALPIDQLARFISESDKCELLHAGNDTDFDKTWLIQPDMTAWSYKIALTFGIGLKVSAYTSGNINAGNVKLTITQIGDGAGDTVIEDLTIAVGSPNLGATGEQIILFHADIVRPIKFNNGLPIKVRIQTESSKSGTATYQIGMLPVFPIIPTAVPKQWLESQVELHLHGDLTHAYPIWRSENNDELMDYSGCASGGCP
jgi:hypothetical protein